MKKCLKIIPKETNYFCLMELDNNNNDDTNEEHLIILQST